MLAVGVLQFRAPARKTSLSSGSLSCKRIAVSTYTSHQAAKLKRVSSRSSTGFFPTTPTQKNTENHGKPWKTIQTGPKTCLKPPSQVTLLCHLAPFPPSHWALWDVPSERSRSFLKLQEAFGAVEVLEDGLRSLETLGRPFKGLNWIFDGFWTWIFCFKEGWWTYYPTSFSTFWVFSWGW